MIIRRPLSSIIIKLIILAFITSAGLMFPSRVFCYDTNIAHPNIAVLAAQLYNSQNSNEKLTDQEISWIRQGAMNEDTPTRWMNHFYDPIHNVGWQGKYFGVFTLKCQFGSAVDKNKRLPKSLTQR